ncbi:MAG: hypothetical protein CMN76_11455 [Spirochaetaceae bacterium]|nr:hypothetical protein [Spirochaetaceae bacterium]
MPVTCILTSSGFCIYNFGIDYTAVTISSTAESILVETGVQFVTTVTLSGVQADLTLKGTPAGDTIQITTTSLEFKLRFVGNSGSVAFVEPTQAPVISGYTFVQSATYPGAARTSVQNTFNDTIVPRIQSALAAYLLARYNE